MALNLDYDHEWKPDAPKSAGPNLDFDPDWKPAPAPKGGLVASAKQAIGSTIKGAGQAAADFLPGVGQDNALKTYGQSVVDANPTAVHSLADLKANPLTGVAEATGNAGGSMGAMLGARALGTGITAAAPFTGPAAPLVAGIGQGIAWLGPMAAAALPSFGGIREQQIKDDPNRQDSIGAKALAAAGAGTVGLIESKFGPQEWALSAMSKEGRGQLAEKFAAKTLGGSVAKGAAKGAAIEGAEEIAQNPIEQIASYQNPLTADNLKDTAFSGVMGALGGGVFGGASGAAFRKGADNKPAATPEVAPADQSIPYAPTTVEEVAKQRADAMGVKPENGPISAAASLAIEGQTAEEMRLATPGILAQGAAAAEQARIAQEARQAAEPGIPYEPVAVEAPQAAPIVPTVPMVDPQIPAQDWINQQTGVDQSSGVTRRDFEAAAKEQADPQTILDESGRPKTTTSALEIQQFHADFDRREALRQRNLSAAERLRAARGGKPLVEDAQPADVAPQPSAPVVDIAQPDIADEAPARIARPAPSPASGGSSAPAMPSVSSLISQGATLQGKNLVDASNNVVLPNLNIQQYREANTLLKSKPNAQAAETPAPAIPVQAAPQGQKQQSSGVTPAQDISGDKINREWTSFAPETGTLAVPRAEMPQIKAEHRGAMANFMNARGVSHAAEEVRADSLRPTQAEFSPSKVKRAMKFQGGDRSILVSADNYVLDGHHQWLAKREAGEPIKVIRLNAPISDLISLAHDFPSSTMAGGATGKQSLQVQAPAATEESSVVQPENSNGNARPASETVPPVSSAQRGVNAGGVGNLRADRGSGTGGQAVRNDAAEPAASVPDSRASGSGERVRQTNLITLVRQAGGVSLDSKADVTGDKNSRETLGVFRKSGMSLDRLAEVLQQNGYITESEVSDVTSGAEKASELLRDALAGNRPLNMADNERAMSDAEEAKQRDAIRKKADELGIKWRFRKTEDVEAEINQREEVAPEDRSAYDYSSESVQDFSDEFDIFNDATPLTGKAAMRAIGFTEEEINEAIQSESRQGQAGSTESAGTQSRRADSGSQAGSSEQGGILESYSEKDLAARDEAQRLKVEEKARADKAADDKARADSERDSFTLTGSDRSADTAAAQGQGDIFDQPAKNAQPTQINGQQETRNNLIARLDAAEDFSEEQSNLIDKLYEVTLSEVSAMHWRGDMPIFETGRNTFMTISPSTQQPGKTQVTLYSNRGISGDTQYDSVEAAVRGERLFGNRILSPADAEDRFAESLNAEAEYQANVSRQRMAPDRPAQNQNPIKAETRSNTGPETESASANQETVKPSPALESLFADLDSSTVRKANKAKKAAKLHPQAAEIDYVQNNYHDILIQLMDAGKLEVNGSKSVTEENKSCL